MLSMNSTIVSANVSGGFRSTVKAFGHQTKQTDQDALTKQEIMKSLGILDSDLKSNANIKSTVTETLSNIPLKKMGKDEIQGEVVKSLEKQIEKLKYQRIKMMQGDQPSNEQSQIREEEEEKSNIQFRPGKSSDEKGKPERIEEKDVSKIDDLLRRQQLLNKELEQKYREKKEMERMRAQQPDNPNLAGGEYGSSAIHALYETVKKSRLEPQEPKSKNFFTNVQRVQDKRGRQAQEIQRKAEAALSQDNATSAQELIIKAEAIKRVDPKKKDFEQKLHEYKHGKDLRESAEMYLSSKNVPDFERVRSSSSFQKLQEHRNKRDITDSPISHKPKNQLNETPAFADQGDQVIRKETQIKISKGKLKSNNELFILKLVFESLDKEKKGRISKADIIQFISSNQDLVTIFDLKSGFNKRVEAMKTEVKDFLNFKEFTQLMMRNLSEDDKRKIEKIIPIHEKPKKQAPVLGTKLLNEDDIRVFRDVFNNLDVHNDLVVKTTEFITALRSNPEVVKIIDKPAIEVPIVGKTLNVDQILTLITNEYEIAVSYGHNTMEYMSWNQFYDYLKNYREPTKLRSNQEESKEELKIGEAYVQIIQDVFDTLPRVTEDYVEKIELIKAIRRDPQIKSFYNEKIDPSSYSSETTYKDLFEDMFANENEYLRWDEVKKYFLKGAEDQRESENKEHEAVAPNPLLGKDAINEAEEYGEEEEFAEGDEGNPERQQQTEAVRRSRSKRAEEDLAMVDKIRNNEHLDDLPLDLREEYIRMQQNFKKWNKNKKDSKGLTVPKPFNFKETNKDTIRKKKVDAIINEKKKEEEDAVNFKFKANSLPPTTVTPLLNTMNQAKEERRIQLKEKAKQITLENQKPFSFYDRDLEAKANKEKEPVKPQEEPKQFKSKPIPVFVNLEVARQKEQEEQKAREERIKKRAEEIVTKSRLPPRMEEHEKNKEEEQAKRIKNPNKYKDVEPSFVPKIKKEVPNFEELQKQHESELAQKKQERPKTQDKPFSFFEKDKDKFHKKVEEQKAADEAVMMHFLRKNPKAGKEDAMKKAKKVSALSNLIAQKVNQEAGNDQEENQSELPAEKEQLKQEESNQEENAEGGKQNDIAENQEENEEGYEQEFDQEEDEKDVEQKDQKDQMKNKKDTLNNEQNKSQQKSPSANATQNDKIGVPGVLLGSTGKDKARTETNLGGTANQENQGSNQENQVSNQLKQDTSQDNKFGFKMTKKAQHEMEFKRKEKEELEKKIQDKRNALEQKKQKEKDFAPKVNSAFVETNKPADKEKERQDKIRESQQQMKSQTEEYNNKIKNMTDKVYSGPMLFEKGFHGSKLLSKYRKLLEKDAAVQQNSGGGFQQEARNDDDA